MHVDACRLCVAHGDEPVVSILSLKCQLSPTWDDRHADSQRGTESCDRSHDLVSRLTVYVKHPCEGEYECGAICQRHGLGDPCPVTRLSLDSYSARHRRNPL